MLNRRDVLHLASFAGTTSAWLPACGRAEGESSERIRIVDSNVSLFEWPFRRLPLDTTDTLAAKLRSLGIVSAWAGSFEGILHRDIAGVNLRLADACRKRPELTPVGSINPRLPGWQRDLWTCIDVHRMPGVRVHPSYHGYTLNDSCFAQLLEAAASARVFVQITTAIEDVRTQHPLLRVPDVDLSPLPQAMRNAPDVRVQILNYRPRSPLHEQLTAAPRVFFDTARVDGTDGVPDLVRSVPAGRVLFGSHAPFLIPEAALIRVHEAGVLSNEMLRDVYSANADRFAM